MLKVIQEDRYPATFGENSLQLLIFLRDNSFVLEPPISLRSAAKTVVLLPENDACLVSK